MPTARIHKRLDDRLLWQKWGPPAILLLTAILWFGGIEWLFPRYFLWDDNATYSLPYYLANTRALLQTHVLPVINFFQFTGWNHLNSGQLALYPPTYAAAWFASDILQDPLYTIDILCILHMTAGMFAMYAWLRVLNIDRLLGILGAIFYLTLPFSIILSRAWVIVAYVHLFAPLCLLLLEKDCREPTIKKFITYAVIKTLFLYAGYPQYVAYLTLCEILYVLLREKNTLQAHIRHMARYAAANILIMILSFPLLLPMAEAALQSVERGQAFPLGMALSGMIDAGHVLAAQLFIFYELPIVNLNTMFHIGGSIFVPWIALKIIYAKAPLPRHIRSMVIIGFLALLLSGPYHIILSVLPVFDHFRWPFKMFFFFSLFYTAALFLTLQWMQQQKIMNKAAICTIIAYAILFHIMLIPFPPRAAYRINDIESPLSQELQGNFRSLGVSADTDSPLHTTLPSFNLGTLRGIPTLAGYLDPLLSRVHAGIIGDIGRSGLLNPSKLPETIAHYSDWSVRYFISDTLLDTTIISRAHLKLLHSGSGLLIYENTKAFPVASFESTPQIPVNITYGTNSVSLHTNGMTGSLRLRLAPIEGYSFSDADGVQQSPTLTEGGLLLNLIKPQDAIEVRFHSQTFEAGIFFTLVGSGLFAIISLLKLTHRKK
jgi:hypothetical protein